MSMEGDDPRPFGYTGMADSDDEGKEDSNKIRIDLNRQHIPPNEEVKIPESDPSAIQHLSTGARIQSQVNPNVNPKTGPTKKLKWDSSEINALNQFSKEENVDLTNHKDLTDLPIPKELSEDNLNKVLADENTKTLIKNVTEDPEITETLRQGDTIGKLTIEDFKNLESKVAVEKQNLIKWLGSHRSIRLHIWAGERNNKSIWIEKEYFFRSNKKKDELKLNLLKSRLNAINIKHNLIANRPLNTLNAEEKSFLDYSSFMIQIADYKVNEYEAKMRFGMNADDFANADGNELALAHLAYAWRALNIPYYRPEQ